LVDYFDVFFAYFFPPLEGKAEVLDRYLANPNCSGHQAYWVHDKVRFHRPDRSDPDFILKICITLVIAASLEVEHGIVNLWSTTSTGFKHPANYGQYLPQNYFRAFICGFPHLWSPEHLWYSESVPWECFKPLLNAFNQRRRDLLHMVYLLMDGSMSALRPKTSATGGLPNVTYELRKPKPLGTMFKNGVEGTTGILVTQDVVEGSASQREKKYDGEESSLPMREPIMAHVAEMLHQCESWNVVEGGWVGGDAWFGLIPCVVELKKKMNVYSTFIIKQNLQYCLVQVIQQIMKAHEGYYIRS
jgi:hypothetical protein